MNGINRVTLVILIQFALYSKNSYSMEFNTDVLDTDDKTNIDLSRFSQSDYVMPGDFILSVYVNEQNIKGSEQDIPFYPDPQDERKTRVCLPTTLLDSLGLTTSAVDKVTTWHKGECLELQELKGSTLKGDVSTGKLLVSIPQVWMEYSDPNWLPPSRWDNGVPGGLLDYNLNATAGQAKGGKWENNASLNGAIGINIGPWRLRGDYQGNYNKVAYGGSQSNFIWSRLYAYRALPKLGATLTLGESYFYSDIFDSFRYTGVGLASDERMLPPNLRGYAPEVRGIAKTNARITVSQQGRVLYETTVAAGPFSIRELSSAVSGRMDVEVKEQDGSLQRFSVDTASVPYLTRPGSIRYKTAIGRPSAYQHDLEGTLFASGEFSWGIANSWSLYGGGIVSGDYNTLSLGVGRDLFMLGALSADVTQSIADLPQSRGRKMGKSYRLSYSKRFDELNSEVTFAGYRFSERNFLSMGQYLDARYNHGVINNSKEMYTITANKSFVAARMSLYLSYSHQSYWERAPEDRYSLSVSRYFDFMGKKNISMSISASRSQYQQSTNDALFLSLSLPLGNGARLGYSSQGSRDSYSQSLSYSNNVDMNDDYRIAVGMANQRDDAMKSQFNGYYTHRGDMAELNLNAGYEQDSYRSAGLSLQGGITATAEGMALHTTGSNGGTRLMLSTDGVAGVPIENGRLHSNRFGIAVLADVNSYYRTDTRIDISQLADDVEASQGVVEAALTEGAIGYRRFGLQQGEKVLAVIRLANGTYPPFGSSVMNEQGREIGIVSEAGLAYLTGLRPSQSLSVNWGGGKQCQVEMPEKITSQSNMLLPCH